MNGENQIGNISVMINIPNQTSNTGADFQIEGEYPDDPVRFRHLLFGGLRRRHRPAREQHRASRLVLGAFTRVDRIEAFGDLGRRPGQI